MKIYKLVALFILATAPALATQYAAVELGTNHLELTNQSDSGLKLGVKGGVKYGYMFENGLRTEFQVSYRRNDFKTTYVLKDVDVLESKEHRHMHAWNYMLNVVYDLGALNIKDITPYLGVGFGYAQNTEHVKTSTPLYNDTVKEKDNRFATQGIIGAKYRFDALYSFGLEYQYLCGQSHAKAHSVGLSLIRHF